MEATVGKPCINLKELFGRQYRVTYEESYRADRGDGARAADPWLMIVHGRYGHIYPFGGNLLAASVDGHPNVAGLLRRLPCCRIHQDGDFGELTVLFEVGDFAKVAKIIRPRRRRQVSPEQRERLRGMGFLKGPQVHVDVQPTARPWSRRRARGPFFTPKGPIKGKAPC
jgi:hypothetical protein